MGVGHRVCTCVRHEHHTSMCVIHHHQHGAAPAVERRQASRSTLLLNGVIAEQQQQLDSRWHVTLYCWYWAAMGALGWVSTQYKPHPART